MHPVSQHPEKLAVAEALVPVQIKDLEDSVQKIVWELLSSRHFHGSLELRWKAEQETANQPGANQPGDPGQVDLIHTSIIWEVNTKIPTRVYSNPAFG